MSNVPLPWPEPKRPANNRPRPAQPAPHYEIQRVYDNGSTGPIEVVPITRPPWSARSGRRGFLGAGIASSLALTALLSACRDGSRSPSGTSTTGTSRTGTSTTETSTTDTTTDDTTTDDTTDDDTTDDDTTDDTTTDDYPTDTYEPPDDGYGGGGGYICTCNKVCTCIPVGY